MGTVKRVHHHPRGAAGSAPISTKEDTPTHSLSILFTAAGTSGSRVDRELDAPLGSTLGTASTNHEYAGEWIETHLIEHVPTDSCLEKGKNPCSLLGGRIPRAEKKATLGEWPQGPYVPPLSRSLPQKPCAND